MKHISLVKKPSGAYGAPHGQPFNHSIAISDEQAAMLIQYNGFVSIEIVHDEELNLDKVVMNPNIELWEAWKSEHPEPESEEMTTEELLLELAADHEERLCLMELGI